jgi:hypothetical protein
MTDTVKIRVYVSTNKIGSECFNEIEIDREAWEEMDDDEKDELFRNEMFGMIEWNWREV